MEESTRTRKTRWRKKQVPILRRSESPQAQLEQKDGEESKCDMGQAISEDVVQQVLETGLDALGGAEALQRFVQKVATTEVDQENGAISGCVQEGLQVTARAWLKSWRNWQSPRLQQGGLQ